MRKVVLLFLCVLVLLTGCTRKEYSIEHIYDEQQEQKEPDKDIEADISDKVYKNMKESSKKAISNVVKKAEKSKNVTIDTDDPVEMVDGVAKKFTNVFAYTIFRFMARLQEVAVYLCTGMSIIGLIFIYFTKRNPIARKWSIFLTALGPVLFFIITFGPAIYYSFLK